MAAVRRLVSRTTLLALSGNLWLAGAAVCAQEPESPRFLNFRPLAAAELGGETTDADDEQGEIETDRDSFTPATTVAGTSRLILESAYTFTDNRDVAESHSFPEFLARYGVAEKLELRLGWNYEVGGAPTDTSNSDGDDTFDGAGIEREHRISYGIKAELSEQDAWVPQSVVMVQGFTLTTGEAAASQVVTTYAWGWTWAERVKFDSAIRYGTASELGDHFGVWAPSTVLKVMLTDQWNVHAEYFGLFRDGSGDDTAKQYFSPGTHYLLTPNLEVGVRVGWGLNAEAANFFANTGVGWRW
jgi:hypothetical protein